MKVSSRLLIPLAAILWIASVSAAMAALVAYKSSPGPQAEASSTWPRESGLSLDPARPTLILFAHPRCVCTRASLAELSVLLTRAERPVATEVVFVRPEGMSEADWSGSETFGAAQRIPGVKVVADVGAREAHLFDARTSGQVVVFQPDGRRVFRGGITGARGHEGDNAGLGRVLALIDGRVAERDQSPVFGCSLE